jgi:hypothetical protein
VGNSLSLVNGSNRTIWQLKKKKEAVRSNGGYYITINVASGGSITSMMVMGATV